MNFKIQTVLLALSVLVAGCSLLAEPTPTPSPTDTPAPSPTPTATATSPPTSTPTPAPLTSSQIFEKVSPAVVFIDTPVGTGSGVLIEQGYILTNAHVVWPFQTARVVFADGTEHVDAPVANWDLMVDLAILGPLDDVELEPLALADGKQPDVGGDVYLIGYPGEVDDFPEPTITKGLVSRLREWAQEEITYFQTDARITGGQSGGALVSDMGDVIGISGFAFNWGEFGLVASAADINDRITQLIAGEDPSGLGERTISGRGGGTSHGAQFKHDLVPVVFVLDQPVGTEVQIDAESESDVSIEMFDVRGTYLNHADDGYVGRETLQTKTVQEGLHFIEIHRYSDGSEQVDVESDPSIKRFLDEDDDQRLKVGEPVVAALDYPGDIDFYRLSLVKGEEVNIHVDSILIDPYITVDYRDAEDGQTVSDDDSGGGLFGTNAEMTYRAPHSGTFYVVVEDLNFYSSGGYTLRIDAPFESAPTPMAPPPTPSPLISPHGSMKLFESSDERFIIQYPADWTEGPGIHSNLTEACRAITICFSSDGGSILMITIESLDDLGTIGVDNIETQDDYVEFYMAVIESNMAAEVEFVSRETLETMDGTQVDILTFESTNQFIKIRLKRLLHFEDGQAFNATYMTVGPNYLEDFYAEIEEMFNYSFRTFQVRRENQ